MSLSISLLVGDPGGPWPAPRDGLLLAVGLLWPRHGGQVGSTDAAGRRAAGQRFGKEHALNGSHRASVYKGNGMESH